MWTTAAPPARSPASKRRRSSRTSGRCLDKEGKNIDAVIVATPDHMHATAAMWCMERGKHVYVQSRWYARSGRPANCARRRRNTGSPPRWATRAIPTRARGRQPRSSGTATSAVSPKCTPGATGPMWPQGLTEIPKEDPVPSTLDWDLWLGVAEKRPFTAGGTDRSRPQWRLLLPTLQLARLLRLRLRRPGRYGLPHTGRAKHGAASFQSENRRRRVHQEGRREPLHVPARAR